MNIESGRDVIGEHQMLVDAALDRDVERLIDLALAHFRKTTTMIVEAAGRSALGTI